MVGNMHIAKLVSAPVRLHLELTDDYLSDYQQRMLKRYGESSTGRAISRDIFVPADMPLHNLHYAIQRLYGWQNTHLRSFQLPSEKYLELTGGTVRGWTDLVGILFQPPGEAEWDLFWDDDYVDGSINVWLKRKYTGPYSYGGSMEHFGAAREDIQELLDSWKMVDVKEPFWPHAERAKKDRDVEDRTLRRAPLIELTLEEMNNSFILDSGTESLLERLEVNKVLATPNQELAVDGVFPVTTSLIYYYDFGDNWTITITKTDNCDDLLENNDISEDELARAEETVLSRHKPVCLKKDGVSVLDDVGGLSGYADFLGAIYEGDDKEERADYRAWAKSLGWSTRKTANHTWL